MLLLLSLACALTSSDNPLILIESSRDDIFDTGSTDTTGTTDTDTDTGGTDTGTSTDPWIVISDPRSDDADGDGIWEPGETLTIWVTMENMRADDYMAYPGVLVESDRDDVVVPDPGGNWFYGIFGLDREDLSMVVEATASAPEGVEVTFTLSLTSLGCDSDPALCLDPQQLTYRRTIGQ